MNQSRLFNVTAVMVTLLTATSARAELIGTTMEFAYNAYVSVAEEVNEGDVYVSAGGEWTVEEWYANLEVAGIEAARQALLKMPDGGPTKIVSLSGLTTFVKRDNTITGTLTIGYVFVGTPGTIYIKAPIAVKVPAGLRFDEIGRSYFYGIIRTNLGLPK